MPWYTQTQFLTLDDYGTQALCITTSLMRFLHCHLIRTQATGSIIEPAISKKTATRCRVHDRRLESQPFR